MESTEQRPFREGQRILVEERAILTTLAAASTYRYATSIFRPSFPAHAGLNAEAREANVVDDPFFLWSFRGTITSLNDLRVLFTIVRFSKQGGWGTSDFDSSYPSQEMDVTGAFIQNRGSLGYQARGEGVISGRLAISNVSAVPIDIALLLQVFGNPPRVASSRP